MYNLYSTEVFFFSADITVGVSDVISIFMNEINLTLQPNTYSYLAGSAPSLPVTSAVLILVFQTV